MKVAALAELHLWLLTKAAGDVLIQVEEDHHRKRRQRCTGHALGRDGREVGDPGPTTGRVEAIAPRVDEGHGKEVLIQIARCKNGHKERDGEGIVFQEAASPVTEEPGRLQGTQPQS